ncbi:MAG: site-specific integrase [Sporomusaceae bacterium]|jgi:integrase|nr:site-specific integrase [Sporomusaceae bacterium]
MEHWYATFKEIKHSPTTRQVQLTYINIHITPNIGSLFLQKVQTVDIQRFLNDLATSGNRSKLKYSNNYGKPLSAWTVKKIRQLLIAAFDAAINAGILSQNPVRDTESVPVQTVQVAYFTFEQQQLFLKATEKHRFHTAYQLLFFTGCRRSEILGLSWDNVNFELLQIQVNQVLVSISGQPFFKNYPKTKASVRVIPIHPDLAKILLKHKKAQENEKKANPNWHNEHNLIFTNKDGSPHNPTYFLHNFKKVIKKLGLPQNLRIHSCRHGFATNLLQQGTAISDVQALGGWADLRVLLEIYSHVVKESQRAAIKKLYERKK